MSLTEEEAKTKRCQEGYAASPGASLNPSTDYVSQTFAVPNMMHSIGAGPAAMATTGAPATAPIFCLGSACMAWRWFDNLDDEAIKTPRGYCGKAGAP